MIIAFGIFVAVITGVISLLVHTVHDLKTSMDGY